MATKSDYNLIIFDVDGTLADRDTNVLLPGVLEWFELESHKYTVALASNQGGVGLRWWMIAGDFGDHLSYPDEDDALDHVTAVVNQLGLSPKRRADLDSLTYMCFAYQSKKTGQWGPIPENSEHDWRWWPEYRKPSPGMLLRAMRDTKFSTLETLMVGDSEQDEQAANAAGCRFLHADDFFGR